MQPERVHDITDAMIALSCQHVQLTLTWSLLDGTVVGTFPLDGVVNDRQRTALREADVVNVHCRLCGWVMQWVDGYPPIVHAHPGPASRRA